MAFCTAYDIRVVFDNELIKALLFINSGKLQQLTVKTLNELSLFNFTHDLWLFQLRRLGVYGQGDRYDDFVVESAMVVEFVITPPRGSNELNDSAPDHNLYKPIYTSSWQANRISGHSWHNNEYDTKLHMCHNGFAFGYISRP